MLPRHTKTNQKLAHELVAKVSQEIAGAFYEIVAGKSDDFFHFYPSQDFFIRKEWGRFIPQAKAQLAAMLSMSSVPDWEKDQIADALIKHGSLPGNIDKRVAAQVIQPKIDMSAITVH